MVIASICNLLFSLKIGFDEYGMLRQEIFSPVISRVDLGAAASPAPGGTEG